MTTRWRSVSQGRHFTHNCANVEKSMTRYDTWWHEQKHKNFIIYSLWINAIANFPIKSYAQILGTVQHDMWRQKMLTIEGIQMSQKNQPIKKQRNVLLLRNQYTWCFVNFMKGNVFHYMFKYWFASPNFVLFVFIFYYFVYYI